MAKASKKESTKKAVVTNSGNKVGQDQPSEKLETLSTEMSKEEAQAIVNKHLSLGTQGDGPGELQTAKEVLAKAE